HVPAFDVNQSAAYATNLTNTVSLSAPWANGGTLYLLWLDDNAVTGSTGITTPVEQPNALDNFKLDFGVCVPPSITTQPVGTNVLTCVPFTLSVTANGSAPSYQWFK